VTFFDPLYLLNRDRYSRGAVADVELAGIAYSMEVVPSGTKIKTAAGDVLLDGAAVLMAAGKDRTKQYSGSFGEPTMNLIELERALRQLRLGGMAAVLETRLRQARPKPWRRSI
jgi:hypothetical protein